MRLATNANAGGNRAYSCVFRAAPPFPDNPANDLAPSRFAAGNLRRPGMPSCSSASPAPANEPCCAKTAIAARCACRRHCIRKATPFARRSSCTRRPGSRAATIWPSPRRLTPAAHAQLTTPGAGKWYRSGGAGSLAAHRFHGRRRRHAGVAAAGNDHFCWRPGAHGNTGCAGRRQPIHRLGHPLPRPRRRRRAV